MLSYQGPGQGEVLVLGALGGHWGVGLWAMLA